MRSAGDVDKALASLTCHSLGSNGTGRWALMAWR
jgi:hypothetical protein